MESCPGASEFRGAGQGKPAPAQGNCPPCTDGSVSAGDIIATSFYSLCRSHKYNTRSSTAEQTLCPWAIQLNKATSEQQEKAREQSFNHSILAGRINGEGKDGKIPSPLSHLHPCSRASRDSRDSRGAAPFCARDAFPLARRSILLLRDTRVIATVDAFSSCRCCRALTPPPLPYYCFSDVPMSLSEPGRQTADYQLVSFAQPRLDDTGRV